MTQAQDAEAEDFVSAVPPQSSIVSGRFFSENSGLVSRSNAAASAAADASAASAAEDPKLSTAVDLNEHDDEKDDDSDPITLPESTHTLLFTEPIKSTPFMFSVIIAAMSTLCLILALSNNLPQPGEGFKDIIPANVPSAVKAAQYFSIFIALLMEEEIPTALYLLRRIPKTYFKSKLPGLNYEKFVCSCLFRILCGYLFLVNVLLILVKADEVLEIFYDVLALQFLQQLDDIAFTLARMSVLSKSMKEATIRKYFRLEFKKSKLGQSRTISLFLKTVYLLNLCAMLAGMCFVTIKQAGGAYQCQEITARHPDKLWEGGIVMWGDGRVEEMILNYPYFNGVYRQEGSHDGRPVYVEMKKLDGAPFDTELPEGLVVKVPAKFQYCKSIRAWVFTHDYLRKSKHDDSDCPWLLRSQETDVFDIEEVEGQWQVWAGVISNAEVSISCNECDDDADCNLNGVCQDDGSCECFEDIDGVTFFGPRCEVRLRDECRTIIGETYNETYEIIEVPWGSETKSLQQYNRPQYMYTGGVPGLNSSDLIALTYSGNRWFGSYNVGGQVLFEEGMEDLANGIVTNYHAFWDRAYKLNTIFVSDITDQDTPVGVDFYWTGEKGEQFGPFGVLYPWSNETGRGYFRCSEPNTSAKSESRYLEGRSIFHDKHPHLLRHKLKKP